MPVWYDLRFQDRCAHRGRRDGIDSVSGDICEEFVERFGKKSRRAPNELSGHTVAMALPVCCSVNLDLS
jgi:hypothetical protein